MIDLAPVPQDLEAEQLVLGAALMGNARMMDGLITDIRLAPSHFYRRSFGAIYKAMVDLHERGEGIDSETVRFELEARLGRLPDSASSELALMGGIVPAIGNWRQYGQRVVRMARWRERQHHVLSKLVAIETLDEDAYTQLDVEDQVADAGHDGLIETDALGLQWADWYDRPEGDGDEITTPWPAINDGLFGGLRPGDSTVLVGHSGMGKSVIGDQLLEHVHDTHGLTGCAYLNEMSHIDRVSRMLSGRAGVSFSKIMRRNLNPAEARRVMKAAANLPFAMQPVAGWGVDAICAHIRRYRWGIAFIDLATRIPATKTSEWDHVSGAIADAARQSGTHVILAVQLNRERNTSAARPMPVLRDLRNTGAWEQDHRNVLILHRREEIDRETEMPVTHDDGVLMLAKVSNGRQGAAERVYLDYSKMRFNPLATDDPRLQGDF